MNTAKELVEYLIGGGYTLNDIDTSSPYLDINGHKISFDLSSNKYSVNGIVPGHNRILDLTKPENHSVVMLLIKLLKRGYSPKVITLEKTWQVGHNGSGALDVMLENPKNHDVYMIEVKSSQAIGSYVNKKNDKNIKQVFSYAIQERNTKIMSFYAYDFTGNKDMFFNVYTANILGQAQNVDDLFDRWNKVFDKTDYISNNGIFNVVQNVKKYSELEDITKDDTDSLFSQFATILRLHSISDKPNAFIKMINLFLAKIGDETSADKNFKVKDNNGNIHNFTGMKFQYIYGIDTAESFMKRLNELYKEGMYQYLKKDIIDYTDDELDIYIDGANRNKLIEILDNLRLKKNNNFAFIDVFDDTTFHQNFEVVRSIVELLENYRFKYETKHQFLGNFFEELLNTSLKQEAGQFFTPYPIVDFMIDSLPYERYIKDSISRGQENFIPSVIDYACGAGHFLISSMSKTQEIIKGIPSSGLTLTPSQDKKIKTYNIDTYSWVNRENCVGIEKDYRLAKTTKIATFLNGDGGAEIISGDGVNKFSSDDYNGTVLQSNSKKIEKFDFLISNPPYSIDGFMRNFTKNGITTTSNDFTLLKEINYKSSDIETYFVERAEQLVKPNGYVAIVLPQSILSGEKYEDMRRFIFENFTIKGMLLTADITFSGTTTSPVILFMKKEKVEDKHYEICIVGSPKYLNPNGKKIKDKEVDFLGYEFSSNRDKPGITINDTSILKNITPIMKEFVEKGTCSIPTNFSQYVKITYLDSILLNANAGNVGDIYPKYDKPNGVSLSKICKINAWKENDFTTIPTKYAEIGDLSDLHSKAGAKKKKSKRFCKKGDILVSSLPKKENIIISDGEYMLTTAIHVLSGFKDNTERDRVYNRLRDDATIKQMTALMDGFKVTYAKISESNLFNNILI